MSDLVGFGYKESGISGLSFVCASQKFAFLAHGKVSPQGQVSPGEKNLDTSGDHKRRPRRKARSRNFKPPERYGRDNSGDGTYKRIGQKSLPLPLEIRMSKVFLRQQRSPTNLIFPKDDTQTSWSITRIDSDQRGCATTGFHTHPVDRQQLHLFQRPSRNGPGDCKFAGAATLLHSVFERRRASVGPFEE